MDDEAAVKLSGYRKSHRKKRRVIYLKRLILFCFLCLLVYSVLGRFGVRENLHKISSGEKNFSGDQWEVYVRLKLIADNLERLKTRIAIYDLLLSSYSTKRGYSRNDRNFWIESRLQLQKEFNTVLRKEQYNSFMSKNGFPFTRREELPTDFTILPKIFTPYSLADADAQADTTGD